MPRYAQIVDGYVINVTVVDDPSDVALEGELVPLDRHEDGRWGIGWKWDGSKPIPPPPPPVFTVEGVPSADGQTPATARVEWPEHPDLVPPEEVTFVLNGATSAPVSVVNRVAELEFTASGPGPITVEAVDQYIKVVVP